MAVRCARLHKSLLTIGIVSWWFGCLAAGGADARPAQFTNHPRSLLATIRGPTNCGKEGTLLVNPLQMNGVRFGAALGISKDASIIVVGAPYAPTDPDAVYPGGAALAYTQYNGGITCVFQSTYLPFTNDTAKWNGAQVAASRDGKFMAVVDGFDRKIVKGRPVGMAPLVSIYIQNTTKSWTFLQRLDMAPRWALITAIAASFNRDGSGILVSYSIDGDSRDQRGSAQVFLRSGSMNEFKFSQDLSDLNHPAGPSFRYGMNSMISPDGSTIGVVTSPQADANRKVVYMYRRLANSGTRYQLVDTIAGGAVYEDPYFGATLYYQALDASIGLSPNGNFVATVEQGLLMLYQVKSKTTGSGAAAKTLLDWQRRCMIAPPAGFVFRGTSGALSMQQPGTRTIKLSVAGYQGALAEPTDSAVFTYRISVAIGALCPTVPLYIQGHYDSWSQFGAAVQLSEDGRVLVVGAPSAEDVNRNSSVGAVYVYDVSIDSSMSANQFVKQGTNNAIAGCVNGRDSNGNPCTLAPKAASATCLSGYTLLNSQGQKVMFSQAGEQVACTDPPAPFFSTSSTPSSPFITSTVSPYTTINPSVKGGVGAPVGQVNWAPATNLASLITTGAPAPAPSATVASSWTPSVAAYNGGMPVQTASSNAVGAATLGYNLASLLLGGGASLPGAWDATGMSTSGDLAALGLPYGSVIASG